MKHWRTILSWDVKRMPAFEPGDRVHPKAQYPWITIMNNALSARSIDPLEPDNLSLVDYLRDSRDTAIARIQYVQSPEEHPEDPQPWYIARWEDSMLDLYLGNPGFSEDEIELA